MLKWWPSFTAGLLTGLLAAGLILLLISRPPRYAIELLPPPTPAPLQVHVAGAVATPGVHTIPFGSRLQDALAAAGGPLEDADLDRVNLAAALEDGQHVYIPHRTPQIPLDGAATSPAQLPMTQKVNVNTATASELESLPGIGPSLAEAIVEYRLEHGLFNQPEDLLGVSGIGQAKLEQIAGLIRFR